MAKTDINDVVDTGRNFGVPVVWLGTAVPEDEHEKCNECIADMFGVDVQDISTIGSIVTNPTGDGPGGRSDYLFWISQDVVPVFAVKRLDPRFDGEFKWLEDVVGNHENIYDADDVVEMDAMLMKWMM